MVSRLVRPLTPKSVVSSVLSYSRRFRYPLLPKEIWFWQIGARYSLSSLLPHIPKHQSNFDLRRRRLGFSKRKWQTLSRYLPLFRLFPTIQAVFVTGSLAMNNCTQFDDIDLMIVTSKHTLWPTRCFFVILLNLLRLRRAPSLPVHSSRQVADKVCDNLWLTESSLSIVPSHSVYCLGLAHEIVQARVLYDRRWIADRLFWSNQWVSDYLPVAFEQLKLHRSISIPKTLNLPTTPVHSLFQILLKIVNWLFFVPQYLYMSPRRTIEKVGLEFAYFHPNPPQVFKPSLPS